MFYLSLLIDNRKYQVINLVAEQVSSSEAKPIPTFVVERNAGEGKTLFSIEDQAKMVFRGGFSKDKQPDWQNVRLSLEGTQLKLSFLPARNESRGFPSEQMPASSDIEFKKDMDRYVFGISRRYDAQKLTVIICFTLDGIIYSGEFLLHLAGQKQTFDVVMDFGSEASQIVMHPRGGAGNEILHRTKIVDKLVKYYYPHLGEASLHQRTDDDELYSSQFFTRKSEAVFDPASPAGKQGEYELLNLLTDRRSIYDLASTHMFVSNLKLAHLGAYPQQIHFQSTQSNIYHAEHKLFDELVLDLQQAVINYFIQMILQELRGAHKKGSQLYAVIKLLVPNVFDQQKVSLIVDKTCQSLMEITDKNPDYPLVGWEVGTISESDASFLGFKREKEADSRKKAEPYWVADKDYLIIDAGKGTIDFSILELSRDNQLTSIFRSGFIGAGNVISYAFVDTIFTALFDTPKQNRQQAIYSICLAPHTDMVAKLAFMQLVEQFKQNYDHTKSTDYRPLTELLNQDLLSDIRQEYRENPQAPTLLTQIVDALRSVQFRQNSLCDEFGLILDTVDLLTGKIYDEIQYSGYYNHARIEKIILTGRGFKFKPFQKAIADKFQMPVDTTTDLKKICLLGAFSGDKINFDSNLVGYPTLFQFVKTLSNQQVREVDKGSFRPRTHIQVAGNIFQNITSQVYQKGADLNRKMQQALSAGTEQEFAEKTSSLPSNDEIFSTRPQDFFLQGQYFEDFNSDAQTVTIGGLDYKNHNITKGRINVFYTGSEFIIRSAGEYSRLGVFPKFFEETQWVFQTLFPFMEVGSAADVQVIREFEDDIDLGESWKK